MKTITLTQGFGNKTTWHFSGCLVFKLININLYCDSCFREKPLSGLKPTQSSYKAVYAPLTILCNYLVGKDLIVRLTVTEVFNFVAGIFAFSVLTVIEVSFWMTSLPPLQLRTPQNLLYNVVI